jgi:hypothetical protein
MSAETEKWILEYSIQLLQVLGVTSVASFIALYSAWFAFPPEIIIEAVSDKSKRLNSESAIKIKNSGKLPAFKIQTEIDQLNATIGNMRLKNCAVKNSPNEVPKLSGGESTEISVSPAIATEHGVELSEFSYLLRITYHTRLFFIKKTFSKTWKVELRTFADGFTWQTTILK